MSPHERFGTVTARIATIPAILRTRREEEIRHQRTVDDLDERLMVVVTQLEKFAAEMEKAIV